MRNILLAFVAFVGLSACEDSEGPSGTVLVESHIFVNGLRFEPSPAAGTTSFVTTSLETGIIDGAANQRRFNLTRTQTDTQGAKSLSIIVVYPATNSSIDGVYDFNAADFDPTNEAQASFVDGQMEYVISEGTISVDDMGSNRYRLTFANTKMIELENQSSQIPFSGYFEGVFSTE